MKIWELTDENHRYREILQKAIEAQKENRRDCWRLDQVGATGGHLSKLKAAGIVESVMESSNRANWYRLTDLEKVEEELESIEEEVEVDGEVEHDWDFESPEFDSIVGYDDVKFILRKALTADKRVNVLLAGPPSLGKSIFLMEIEEAVENASYGYGSEDTSAGLLELLFNKQPQILLIDEVEEMTNEHYSVLEQLMEHGKIHERKYGKTRSMEIDTRVFAACNDVDKIPVPIKSRFRVMHLEEYDRKEFIEVVVNVLVEKEDVDEETARKIGERVHDQYDSNDIRDAIGIARLADSPEEVDRVIEALSEHK